MYIQCENYRMAADFFARLCTPSSMITFYVKHQNDYQDFNYFAQKFLIKVKSLLGVGIDFTLEL